MIAKSTDEKLFADVPNSVVALERRGNCLAAMEALLDVATLEDRELNPLERMRFDRLENRSKELLGLSKDLHAAEVEPGPELAEHVPRDGSGCGSLGGDYRQFSSRAAMVDDGGRQVRGLGRGESFADEVRRLQPGSGDYGGLSLGALCRAMVSGPKTEVEQRALSEGSDSAGGYSVPSSLAAQLIDRLRTKSTIFAAGARTIPLTTDQNTYAKLSTDPTATWRSENESISDNSPTFGSITFQPRSLVSLVRASREVIEDSANLESALMNAFSESMALEIDRVAYYGQTGQEPTGLRYLSDVGEIDVGTNGLAITDYSFLLDALQDLQEANASPPTAVVMSPRTVREFTSLEDNTSANRRPEPLSIVELPRLVSSQISITETQGSSTDASTIFVGDFSELIVGMRSELRIEVLKERFADNHQFGFLAHLRADLACWHQESFVRIVGTVPA